MHAPEVPSTWRQSVSSRHAAFLLDVEVILGDAIALFHDVFGAAIQDAVEFRLGEVELAALAHAGGNLAVEGFHDFVLAFEDIGAEEIGFQQSHTAVDIVTDTAGGDDTLIQIEGSHAADGEAVALVGVTEGDGGLQNARELGHAHHLGKGLVSADGLQQELGGVHDPGNPHGALLRDAVRIGGDGLEFHG